MENRTWIFGALVAVGLFVPIAAGQPYSFTARIQGRVLDEDGSPVAKATVSYGRARKAARTADGRLVPAAGEPDIFTSTTTSADGSFGIPDLPRGEYTVCVVAAGFMGSCDWSTPHCLTLADEETADLGQIRLIRGALVEVRVNDVAGLIPDENPNFSPLIIGIRSGASFHPVRQVGKDGTGKVLAFRVPFGKPLSLWVYSNRVRVSDALGAAIPENGREFEFTVPAGATQRGFTLNVQGLR
jgi:hypothetical protein